MSSINVIDRATPQLAALMARVQNPLPGLQVAGRAVCVLLKSHFQQKHDSNPNKLGGTRQNFWLQVKHGVNQPQTTGSAQVTVSISHPAIMQKIKGGTITAKRASMLTIPVRPEAYGRRASALEHALGIKLFVIAKGGRAYLAGRNGDALRIYYVLKRSVTQKPDATALPPEQEMADVATKAFSTWVIGSQKMV